MLCKGFYTELCTTYDYMYTIKGYMFTVYYDINTIVNRLYVNGIGQCRVPFLVSTVTEP